VENFEKLKLKNEIVTSYFRAETSVPASLVRKSNEYSSLVKIYDFMAAIPITSMECERTFSAMNLIMSSLRNCLENDTLEDLMLISVYGPDDIRKFDPLPAIDAWKKQLQENLYDFHFIGFYFTYGSYISRFCSKV